MNPILEAALLHHAEGRSVIAVNQDKRPYHEGWNSYFAHKQTQEELDREFSNGSHGLALILYPSCQFCVLDFDGPHANEAWESTGVSLPTSARIKTRSGGKHLYYRMPADVPQFKRKVRIVKADCGCKKTCGVDLLIHGYALARTLESTEAELLRTILPHPTLSETLHEAVLAAFGRPRHL